MLFDRACELCQASVGFAAARDAGRRLAFVPLQSEQGRDLLERHGLAAGDVRSFVLLEGGRRYRRSGAALRLARRLGWPWKLAWGLMIVPAPLRDAVYDFVARNRRRWRTGAGFPR